ncbi:MAG: SPASM domain-containing protein [Candidatus Zixiibacteriota bacterium]|nr:MAG: SPASM domain-containing protein [candidate division Zixibacteria bacterium]
MTEENFASYRELVDRITSGTISDLTPEEEKLLQQLEYGRFIYPDDYDELEALKFQHHLSRFEQSQIGFTLAPTMACNMACGYCFEENKRGRMPAKVIEGFIDFVEKRAPGLLRVDINWYGGEPLLAMGIIEDITETLLDLGQQHNFLYTASMISNGYLLSRETVDRLAELKISMIQVTLDGPARLHNAKRPLKNGGDSFDRIVENISYASTKMAIGVRVNIDKSFNKNIIEEMLEELKRADLQDRVGVYFGQLEASATVCANISESCYNANEFSAIEVEYYRLLLDHGFRIERLPSPTSAYCIAQQINGFLLDPDGDLYRCFNHAGDKSKTMGNIRDSINYRHQNFMRLFRFDPFDDESCRNCSILPICLGGCPARRADRGMTGDEMCESWKHNLRPMLEIIARSKQLQAAMTAKEQ